MDEQSFDITVKTLQGLEEILRTELEDLGAKKVRISKRACLAQVDKETLYKANLHLRTAVRILKPFYEFVAFDEHRLYKKIKSFDWTELMDLDTTFAIDSTVNSTRFKHSKYVALKIKDAIVDQFREKYGKRPSIDTQNPDLRLHAFCNSTNFSLSLDSSGDALYKRGYRMQGHKAPLSEVLGAGLVLLTGWNGDVPLYDPMCGSGTIAIEAAMIACNMPPNFKRNSFGFQKWKDFDKVLWNRIIKEAKDNISMEGKKIYASDISEKAVNLSKESVNLMGLKSVVSVKRTEFASVLPHSKQGVIVMNPPYGERLKEDEINDFYSSIGDTLKKKFEGYDAWIFSGNKDAIKRVGLKTSKKLQLTNGAIECKFHKYELYKGSKKEI